MSPPGSIPFYLLTILINYLYQVESSDHHYQQQTYFANPEYHPILNTQYYDFNGTDIGNSNSSAYSYDTASSYQQQPLKYYYQYDSSSSQYSPEKDYYSSYIVPYSKSKDQETAGVHWRLTKRHPSFTKRRGKYEKKKKGMRRRDPTYSRSDYRLPSRRRHYNNKYNKKNKWIDRQGGFFDDVFDEFSLDSILPELPVPDFLLRGLHDYDVGEEEEEFDDLFDFGSTLSDDNEDNELEPEESYHRPWALGGVESYGRHPMSFGSYGGGMRDRVQSPSKRRVFGRYGMKAVFGKGFKFLIALLLLPLILLFIPIPITIYTGPKGKNSRNDDLSSSSSSSSSSSENSSHTGWGSIHDLSRRFLSSENCIERISCEINRFQHDNGPESQDHSFTRFIRFVKSYGTSFFPSFLVRVAKGYTQKSDDDDGVDNQCAKFTCENLQGFLGKKK